MTEVKSVFPFRFLFLMHRWKEKQRCRDGGQSQLRLPFIFSLIAASFVSFSATAANIHSALSTGTENLLGWFKKKQILTERRENFGSAVNKSGSGGMMGLVHNNLIY